MRLNEMISRVRSDAAVKLFGDDFDVPVGKAGEIENVLRSVAGNADVAAEQITGQPVLQITMRQDEIARCGVAAREVLDLVESLGSLLRLSCRRDERDERDGKRGECGTAGLDQHSVSF